jgi:hypothetical protein
MFCTYFLCQITYTRIFLCIDFVCTTAYSWSSAGRSSVALTVHWIDKKTRERVMGVLACHRIEGPQTFEKLAELMWDVHARFGLEGKITRTVTDNGANFVKSFRKFGPRSGLAATAHKPPAQDMDNVEEVLPSQPQPQPLDRNEREDGACAGHDVDDELHLHPSQYEHVMWQIFLHRALRRADLQAPGTFTLCCPHYEFGCLNRCEKCAGE